MSAQFYSDARWYDRLFPGGERAVDFYRAEADRQVGRSWSCRRRCWPRARRKSDERDVAVEWVQGDMRDFDLGRTFDAGATR